MSELKRGHVLSFDDGLLRVKVSGYGEQNGWATLSFRECQAELDANGFYAFEIAPTELREINAFLSRVIAEMDGTP